MKDAPTRSGRYIRRNPCYPLCMTNTAEADTEKSPQAHSHLSTAGELSQRVQNFLRGYYLVDVRKDREAFFSLSKEDVRENPLCLCGIFLNLAMDGNLEKAGEIINSMEEGNFLRDCFTLVYPCVSFATFVRTIERLKKNGTSASRVVLTAGRPSVLNGLNDFTRLSPLLERQRERIIGDLAFLYETSTCGAIYSLCLAESYYQQNRLLDAEVIVSRVIKDFDKEAERRLLFVALYLQTKILLASGKTVDAGSYITDIRNFVKEDGEAEFSFNIDAAEAMIALYEGRSEVISDWLESDAPDEFADFNMLDLYRYMVKMRCYIVNKKYTAVVALAEKLRPLLEKGKRHMDLCELDLLLATAFYRAEEKPLAFEALFRALKTARRRKYYRLVADEGDAILHLLIDYVKEKGESDFLTDIITITRNMAIRHPLYLKKKCEKTEKFTQTETDILCLLEQGKSKEEIAECFLVSVNTVKFHIKNIYAKLEASSATQAVWNARQMGLLLFGGGYISIGNFGSEMKRWVVCLTILPLGV